MAVGKLNDATTVMKRDMGLAFVFDAFFSKKKKESSCRFYSSVRAPHQRDLVGLPPQFIKYKYNVRSVKFMMRVLNVSL